MTDTEALAKALEDYADKWKEPKTSGLPARPAAAALRAAEAREAATRAANLDVMLHFNALKADYDAAEARIKALTEALKEAEDFISDNHENLTTGDGDTFDAEMTLKLIRAALSPAPEDTRHD